MAVSVKRKQEEKHLQLLREMTSGAANRKCFDCEQRGPTYVNMTVGSFVCTTCSGILYVCVSVCACVCARVCVSVCARAIHHHLVSISDVSWNNGIYPALCSHMTSALMSKLLQ
ncbi:arf-GAP domain and FG repeat-containing protein 1b isoform X1 [Tachysurus ichikawai]